MMGMACQQPGIDCSRTFLALSISADQSISEVTLPRAKWHTAGRDWFIRITGSGGAANIETVRGMKRFPEPFGFSASEVKKS
jgi:hypothetical protein